MHAEDNHDHGHDERRTVKIVGLAEGLLFPHAAQTVCLTRRIRPAGAKIRGHWSIEVLHHIRDATRTLTTLGINPA
ncbi:hypothetical protein [Actinomadura sp. HBU206391]|uniref:hypothetical protein n=1 Tax=Actinomadura sp. HBU206391 TaxID=2731692 RepID=UPI0016502DFE|nr:hypothetical protein [Actinomadura sp. HBU206391]MBC6463517.1 hypothetical protein [Actinomadura sp. HBU206391]